MASREGIDSAILTRLGADNVQPFTAVKAEFDTDDVLIWSGIEDITINSETYTGAGTFLGIDTVEEDAEINSNGIAISLSYMDPIVLNYALTESYQNRPITILIGFTMGGSNEVAGVMTLFKGRMQTMRINDTPEGAVISLTAENRLIDLSKPRGYRYTNQAQQHLFSGDLGMQYISKIQEKQIFWGKKQPNNWSGGPDNDYRRNFELR